MANFYRITESESEASDVPQTEFLTKFDHKAVIENYSDSSLDAGDVVVPGHLKIKNQAPAVKDEMEVKGAEEVKEVEVVTVAAEVSKAAEAATEDSEAEFSGVMTRSRARALAQEKDISNKGAKGSKN